jgi:hypothetical protein
MHTQAFEQPLHDGAQCPKSKRRIGPHSVASIGWDLDGAKNRYRRRLREEGTVGVPPAPENRRQFLVCLLYHRCDKFGIVSVGKGVSGRRS